MRSAKDSFQIVVAQTRPHFGEVERNVTEALELVDKALGGKSAHLVVLPELFHTGYVFGSRAEARALAEDPRRGPTAASLAAFARARRLMVVAGFCERAGRVLHNSAIWVDARGTRAGIQEFAHHRSHGIGHASILASLGRCFCSAIRRTRLERRPNRRDRISLGGGANRTLPRDRRRICTDECPCHCHGSKRSAPSKTSNLEYPDCVRDSK